MSRHINDQVVDILRRVHAALEAAYAEGRKDEREESKVLLEALVWREQFEPREGENSNDRFERIAEVFYRETGHLRPGKDCLLESLEVRQAAWDEWMEAGRARVRAAIAKYTGEQ